ncbi:vWA domain-containing protein [Kribbella sp. CA-245084]|uniref:vWA domain-containing protein n=1 Tax=Kribbella sp. CA-245084 TaxID=3239940 RepID=UPI003D8CDFE7
MPKQRKKQRDQAWEAIQAGWTTIVQHPLFAPIADYMRSPIRDDACPADAWAIIDSNGQIQTHRTRRATPDEWTWVFAHLLIHLGLGHADRDRPEPDHAAQAACDVAVNRYLQSLKLGSPIVELPASFPAMEEDALARLWRREGVPAEYDGLGAAGHTSDVETARWNGWGKPPEWGELFAAGLSAATAAAVEIAGGARSSLGAGRGGRDKWDLALGWFVSSYPLLGAIASSMTIVAEAELARGWDIHTAAVNAAVGEIYVNPLISMTLSEWRFVMAHEMLHAALRHGERVGGRDPYLWNVAADLVINGWLLEMGVGSMPDGALDDPVLKGMSAEEVYDRITTDLRRYRKLATLRGVGLGDVLGHPLPHAGEAARGAGLDDIYRRALTTGLAYHDSARGTLPAGLVEEIRALDHPPLAWDAQLARWFEEHVPAVEKTRTYARASRRQSGTPDIPRPGWIRPVELDRLPTYGVVLDTSGSMDRELLGKALGAIASYSRARDVPAARVVYCDAAAYDAGYVPVDDIAGRVQVRGRGGTVLQPGVDLLERAKDFPAEGPILLITDGQCDVVRVRREHAWLIPRGASLPFTAKGPVFRVE